MATMQDVAKLAKVSISSVSNVLNGRTERLRPETTARVQQAIRLLGYRPNQAARQLKTGRNPVIGLLVPSTANPFYGQIAAALESYAQRKHGYRVMLCNTHRDRELEARMLEDLSSFGVAAAILVSSFDDERHIEQAIARGLAVVSYDRAPGQDRGQGIDHVYADNVEAGRLAAQHLIEHGHRRLAFVMPAGRTNSRDRKIEGFLRAGAQAAEPVSAQVYEGRAITAYGDSELADIGYELGQRLAGEPSPPTGVVAVNDTLALGLMAGLRAAGKSVPQDVSVVGMDNMVLAAFTHPPLTSIAMPVAAMAQAMVDRAVQRITAPQAQAEQLRFEPTLVVRGSVRAPARTGHGDSP
ncbi:LacI family DNA-binding transcriptional regulator [Orrella sp. JC864]|uniref:LacI family DNA-binding transcriptional regulator n=1 Tax=Orrella sp. JC864 TaxID=3120298 RepID=UPI00300B8204